MYNYNQTFPYTFESPEVACVRHAVSLDELRAGFRSNVYKDDPHAAPALLPDGTPKVMNVWFPGVHSDVGGGYLFKDSGLAMGAFEWMVREAEKAGLRLDPAKVQTLLGPPPDGCPPDANAPIHNELKGAWKAMEYLPARRYNWDKKEEEWRYAPNKPRTLAAARVYLHQSVLDRINGTKDYWPAAVPKMTVDELKAKYTIVDTIKK